MNIFCDNYCFCDIVLKLRLHVYKQKSTVNIKNDVRKDRLVLQDYSENRRDPFCLSIVTLCKYGKGYEQDN